MLPVFAKYALVIMATCIFMANVIIIFAIISKMRLVI